MGEDSPAARGSYFNYFTEVEEHFQRARGTGLFLLSPIDWALLEGWKNAGVPLEAVLRGIDLAFENWRSRKRKFQQINSLTFCTQLVMAEAKLMAEAGTARRREVQAPFSLDELRTHLAGAGRQLREQAGYGEIADALDRLQAGAESHYADLEQLEQRLTALEEKMAAIARTRQPEDHLFRARRELDLTLRPYRSKMSAEQLAMLERHYLERRLLEDAGLPRLSLFYLR
ncbi:MAG TPA: hypothetical protein VFL57_11910 [Bryobacteraceae bacterium]|nr:hypothetical protein [Bryobacteraceae bacterium]